MALALGASLVLNGVLLWRSAGVPKLAPAALGLNAIAGRDDPSTPPLPVNPTVTSRAQTTPRQEDAGTEPTRALFPFAAPSSVLPAAFTGRGKVDAELEQDALREIALRHVREDWLKDRENITSGVIRDLHDADKQKRELEKDIQQFGDVVGLDDAQRDALRSDYGGVRSARVNAILQALEATPPDYAAAATDLRALYADEDRLMSRYGDAALLRFRQSQLESRTVVLAIVTAFADQPWDGLSW